MKNLLRWLAVVPSAVLAWFVALFASFFLHAVATKLCPTEFLISGYCMAPWFHDVERAIMFFGIALSAVLVVTVAAVVAPSHRVRVTWAILGTGALAAIALGWAMPFEAAVAIGAGLVAAFVVSRVVKTHDA